MCGGIREAASVAVRARQSHQAKERAGTLSCLQRRALAIDRNWHLTIATIASVPQPKMNLF